MSLDFSLGNPLDPAFGTGVTRRRIRLTGTAGAVFAELEDHAHAMRLHLRHAAGRITAIEPDFHRYPLTTCPGAADPLRAIVGLPVGLAARDFFVGGLARRNCTHMLDLAWLASRHAARAPGVRTYAIDIPDGPEGREEIVAACDGAELFRLVLHDGLIVAPPPFAGQRLFRGFVTWVGEQTVLDETWIDAAMIAQKVCMIVAARRYSLPPGKLSERERRETAGLCHGYAADAIDRAERRADQLRNFSTEPDRLLQFF